MATRDVRNIRRTPGKLIAGPTDLTAPPLYGGVELGVLKAQTFRPNAKVGWITAEEFADAHVDGIYAGFDGLFAGVMRTWDRELLTRVCYEVTPGSDGGTNLDYSATGDATRAGRLISEKAIKLLFVPFAPAHHEGLLLLEALPMLDSAYTIQLSKKFEWGLGVAWWAAPASDARTIQYRKLKDMVL